MMEGSNWIPAAAAAQGDPAAVEVPNEDWRSQLHPEARQRIVNKIMETLKKHLPVSVELKKIAIRFEEKIYTAAINQSDYLRKISVKMLSMETMTQPNTAANPSTSYPVVGNLNPADSASIGMQSQVSNQGQPLSLPLVNPYQLRQPRLSPNLQNNTVSDATLQGSGGLSSSLPFITDQSNISNISQTFNLQNPMNNSAGQGATSNIYANAERQIQSQQQQQQPIMSQQQYSQNNLIFQHQLKQQLLKQTIHHSSLLQPHMQQQNQLQSSPLMQMTSNLQAGQPAPQNTLQQNQQNSIQQSMPSLLQQHPQSVTRQQQTRPASQQQSTISQQKQQQQLMGQQTSMLNMQQNNMSDVQKLQQQQRLPGQQNNIMSMQQPQQMLNQQTMSSHQQQQLGQHNNITGLQQQQQQQQLLGSQSSVPSMQSYQRSMHFLQQSNVQAQQNSLQAQSQQTQLQSSQQQLMSQIQSQPPPQMQQQPNTLQREMQQRFQASVTMLQSQNTIEHQKQFIQPQRGIPEVSSSTSMDSTAHTRHTGVVDWQEETYQKVTSLKELYSPELNEIHQRISMKLQMLEALPSAKQSDQVDNLRNFKQILERNIAVLQITKNNIQEVMRDRLPYFEKQILSLLNGYKIRKDAHSQLQGEQHFQNSGGPAHSMTQQQTQPPLQQLDSHVNQAHLINLQGSSAGMQSASVPHMTIPSNQQNILKPLQPASNLDTVQGNSFTGAGSLHITITGSKQTSINDLLLDKSLQNSRSRLEIPKFILWLHLSVHFLFIFMLGFLFWLLP